ncbi:MAG: type VII toxin-antitoxin system MntA family adenylyltransferase antitoxin [Betaproteobacteria bacterium]
MASFNATAAKNRFGELLEAAARGPVAIERHGRVVAYVVAPGHFAAQRGTVEERLAGRLRAAGAAYAAIFGSLARDEARADSDLDLAVSFGKPMSADLRLAVTGLAADVAGRSVDLVDLEAAQGLILARALGGREILCDAATTRQRMIAKVQRAQDDRISATIASRAARSRLFA